MRNNLWIKAKVVLYLRWWSYPSAEVGDALQFKVSKRNGLKGKSDDTSGLGIMDSASLEHSHLPLVRTFAERGPGRAKTFKHSHLPRTFLIQLRSVVQWVSLKGSIKAKIYSLVNLWRKKAKKWLLHKSLRFHTLNSLIHLYCPRMWLLEHPHLPGLSSLIHSKVILFVLVIFILSFEHPEFPFLILLRSQRLVVIIIQLY